MIELKPVLKVVTQEGASLPAREPELHVDHIMEAQHLRGFLTACRAFLEHRPSPEKVAGWKRGAELRIKGLERES